MYSLSILPSLTTRRNRPTQTQPIRAMRAVVQRVASASCEVEGRMVSEIGPGLLVLVGIHQSDSDSDAEFICRKVLNMRLFPNETTGRGSAEELRSYTSLETREFGGTAEVVLLLQLLHAVAVSQFTLYGFLKGNKPDFHVAMPPQKAEPFYASFVDRFKNSYNPDKIKDGVFGAKIKVNLVNDGPVTMQLDCSLPNEHNLLP